MFHEEAAGVGEVVDMEELTARGAGAPDGDGGGARLLGLVELADEGREDVGGLEVEVVAGAVEVGGHGADGNAHNILKPLMLFARLSKLPVSLQPRAAFRCPIRQSVNPVGNLR